MSTAKFIVDDRVPYLNYYEFMKYCHEPETLPQFSKETLFRNHYYFFKIFKAFVENTLTELQEKGHFEPYGVNPILPYHALPFLSTFFNPRYSDRFYKLITGITYLNSDKDGSVYMKRDCAESILWLYKTFIEGGKTDVDGIGETFIADLKDFAAARNAEIMIISAQKKGTVLSVDSFKARVKSVFTPATFPRILLLLYAEVPARDDLQLRLVEFNSHIKENQDDNLIVEELTAGSDCNLFIYDFERASPVSYVYLGKTKTFGKHLKAEIYPVSLELTEEIKTFVQVHKTDNPEWLFGKGKNSQAVRRYMKKIGIEEGNINYIRRMHNMEAVTSMNGEQIVETARKMGHAVQTSLKYLAEQISDTEKSL